MIFKTEASVLLIWTEMAFRTITIAPAAHVKIEAHLFAPWIGWCRRLLQCFAFECVWDAFDQFVSA